MMGHNLWSGGDYLHNLEGFITNYPAITVSSDYCTNGQSSFKITKTTSEREIFLFFWLIPYTQIGNTLKLTWDTQVISSSYYMTIRCLDNTPQDLLRESVGVSQSGTNNSITITVPENTEYLGCMVQFDGDIGDIVYIDNLCISEITP